jgi:hypothetical protein
MTITHAKTAAYNAYSRTGNARRLRGSPDRTLDGVYS